jgi:serine/threonine protein phosphatase PrpC
VTSATAQGLRDAQEDRCVVARLDDGRGWILGVFDGHNGAAVAELAAQLLPEAFRQALARQHDAKAAVEATIGALRAEAADRYEGSSASLAFVDERSARVTIGVLGDSPVIFRDDGGNCLMGPLHNTFHNPEDAQRAIERGALLVGPYLVRSDTMSGVNLTRTIGDAELDFLGRTAEVVEADLGPESFVVLMSDGVFNRVAATPAVLVERTVALIDSGVDPQAIVDDALAGGSDDNVTVVLWRAA